MLEFSFFSFPVSRWIYTGIYSAFILVVLFTILLVILENRNPVKAIAWVVVLALLPIAGFILYLFFGQQYRHKRMISKRKRTILQKLSDTPPSKTPNPIGQLSAADQQQIELGSRLGGTRLFIGNRIDIFTDGRSKFEALKEEMEKAVHFIHLQYYIFANDTLGKSIREILIRKARQGVKVRILYDDVGNWRVKSSFFKPMRKVGIEVHPFFRVSFPQLANNLNYRNHRKVVVIDGKVGFIGGMNIADRYQDGLSWGKWRDTHARIKGSAVYGLQTAFSIDWSFTTKEFLSDNDYYPLVERVGDTNIQILTSGPLGEWKEISLSFLKAISNARKYIYIQTPYFLPTDSLLIALQTAALSKVDVRIMIPRRSDSRLLQYASQSYLKDVLLAGVKIYFYEGGFLHAKSLVIDDELSSIGSTNFDFRSFDHNFEINAFLYSVETAVRMKNIFIEDIRCCRRLTLSKWKHRPAFVKLVESLARLMSPIL